MTQSKVNLNQHPNDRIIELLSIGLTRDEIWLDIFSTCFLSLQTAKQKQHLADTIAQIESCNVFVTGRIPTAGATE